MKLADLDARFVGSGGAGISNADGSPAPERHGIGVMMNCPCGCEAHLFVPFANPIDGGPNENTRNGQPWGWNRTGDTIETLTLAPSVHRNPDVYIENGCPNKWHGFITNGEAKSC